MKNEAVYLNATHYTVTVQTRNAAFRIHFASYIEISIADKMNTFPPFPDIPMAILWCCISHMNHQEMLHMQNMIEKMLPQRKEVTSMNAGATDGRLYHLT